MDKPNLNPYTLTKVLGLLIMLLQTAQCQNYLAIEAPLRAQVTEGSLTDTAMWITWDAVPKSDSYSVSLIPPTITATGIGSNIVDTNTFIEGLLPNTEYQITIRAMKDNRMGNPKVISQRTALPSPSDVWAVEASVSQSSMSIAWSIVDDAQSYTVEVSPSTGISGAGRGLYAPSTRLRGLSPNTLYVIHVYAVNYVGNGARAELQQFTKLGPPRDLRVVLATVSPTAIGVQWRPVIGASNYMVRVTPGDSMNGISPVIQDTHLVLRNLKPDTQYTIQIAASNAAGTSVYSSVNQKTLSMCFATAKRVQDDTFSLVCPPRCSRYQNNVYGTREYTSDSNICAAAIHDERINDNIGGTVVVKMRPGISDFVGTTNNGIISLDYNSWHRSFAFGLQPPDNIRIQPGSVEHDKFTILWNAVRGAINYRVSLNTTTEAIDRKSNTDDTRYTMTGLSPDTTYQIYVFAVNDVETSDAASVIQKTTLEAPSNVQIVDDSVHYDRLTVAWDAMNKAYRYQILLRSNGRIVAREETSLTSYTLSNLTSGTLYNLSVRAINEIGMGQVASIVQYTALQSPRNVIVRRIEATNLQIEWDPVQGASRYNVSVYQLGLEFQVVESFARLQNLLPDTLYNVTIIAVSTNDRSRGITVEQRTALGAPYAEFVPGGVGHDSVSIAWEPLGDATYYISIRPIDDMSQYRNYTSVESMFTFTDLTERTVYTVSIVGRNSVGYGSSDEITFETLIKPPGMLEVIFDGLQTNTASVHWEPIGGITQYYLTCEPSEDIQELGVVYSNTIRLSGFHIGVAHNVSVMAMNDDGGGENTTISFMCVMPPPKVVAIHSITNNSLLLEWDQSSFNITKVTYNFTRFQNPIEMSVSDAANGHLSFEDLTPNTEYQFDIYSSQMSTRGNAVVDERPIVSKTVLTGRDDYAYASRYDAILFWPKTIPMAPTEYTLTAYPNNNIIGLGITTGNSATLSGLRLGQAYNISVIATDIATDYTSSAASFRLWGDDDYNGPFYSEGFDSYDDGMPPFNRDDDISNNDPNSGQPNPFNPNSGGTEAPVVKENSKMWIAIVIVVACVVGLLVCILVPCLCGYRQKNKPLLRYSGWCGCCHTYPTAKYTRNEDY